jgi:hypothetical protein
MKESGDCLVELLTVAIPIVLMLLLAVALAKTSRTKDSHSTDDGITYTDSSSSDWLPQQMLHPPGLPTSTDSPADHSSMFDNHGHHDSSHHNSSLDNHSHGSHDFGGSSFDSSGGSSFDGGSHGHH